MSIKFAYIYYKRNIVIKYENMFSSFRNENSWEMALSPIRDSGMTEWLIYNLRLFILLCGPSTVNRQRCPSNRPRRIASQI